MKYSVLGFNQEVVLSYKREVKDGDKSVVVKLDLDDLLILKEIADLANRPSIEKKILDGAMYCWIQYKLILEDLPILDISKKRLQQRLDKLCMFDLIERRVEKVQGVGTFHYVRVSNEYENLLYDRDRNNFNTDGNKFLPDGNIFPPKDNTTIQYKNTQEDKEKEIDKSISKKKALSFDVRADLSYVDEEFSDIWNEWLDYKDEIKKQYKTQRGAKMQYASLLKYADNNVILANAIVKRSIEQSWDGVFELSDKQKTLFLSSNSPYAIEVPVSTPTESKDTITINGQVYR